MDVLSQEAKQRERERFLSAAQEVRGVVVAAHDLLVALEAAASGVRLEEALGVLVAPGAAPFDVKSWPTAKKMDDIIAGLMRAAARPTAIFAGSSVHGGPVVNSPS